MEDKRKEEEVSRWWPNQLRSQTADPPSATLGQPSLRLCYTQMLLFLTLWALVPCLVLLTLYFLSSTGGKSGGNKKNDGVKVSPPGACRPVSGRDLLSGLGQVLASLTVTCQVQGQALPRSPSLCSGVCLLPCLLGADWEWQVAWVAWSSVKGADLEEASGALWDWTTVTRGSKRGRNGH